MSVSWGTIRRLFTGIDIAAMREVGHILDDYDYVVQNANVLYRRLADGTMPPPPYGPWDRRRVELFKQWINAGCPYEPQVDQTVRNFVGLSGLLTGFHNLDQDLELGAKYLERLYRRAESHPGQVPRKILDALIAEYGKVAHLSHDEQHGRMRQFADRLFREGSDLAGVRDQYVRVTKAIIVLWYTGTFVNQFGFSDGDNGTPEDNQFADGLVWRAGLTHPMGFSTEGGDYWKEKPESDGRFTGLGNTATHWMEIEEVM